MEVNHLKIAGAVIFVAYCFQDISGITLQYSPFAVFVWPSPLLMCVTYPVLHPTEHDWLYSWFHGGCVDTAGEVYSS